MVILISGATHTGKTALAQKLMERYKIPYYSMDHIKMGLIRSGRTSLTPSDDEALVPYLWSVFREIVKTAIENKQSLIIEGCYIPFGWRADFGERYLSEIKYYCLVMTENYILKNYSDILKFENVVECRLNGGDISREELIAENARNLQMCREYGLDYVLIDGEYKIDVVL